MSTLPHHPSKKLSRQRLKLRCSGKNVRRLHSEKLLTLRKNLLSSFKHRAHKRLRISSSKLFPSDNKSSNAEMQGEKTNEEVSVAVPLLPPLPPLLRLSDELLLMILEMSMGPKNPIKVLTTRGTPPPWRVGRSPATQMQSRLQLVCKRIYLLLSEEPVQGHNVTFYSKNKFVFPIGEQFNDYRRYLTYPRNSFFENVTLQLALCHFESYTESYVDLHYKHMWTACNECPLKHLNILVRPACWESPHWMFRGNSLQQWLDKMINHKDLRRISNLKSFTFTPVLNESTINERQRATVRKLFRKAEVLLQARLNVPQTGENQVEYL